MHKTRFRVSWCNRPPRNHETILCHCELAAPKNAVCHHPAANHLTCLTSRTQGHERRINTGTSHAGDWRSCLTSKPRQRLFKRGSNLTQAPERQFQFRCENMFFVSSSSTAAETFAIVKLCVPSSTVAPSSKNAVGFSNFLN